MGALHLIGGEKGGVGKSFTARLLAQYFVDVYQPFIGFDSDKSHGTFTRFYSDFVSDVRVDDFNSLDAIIEAAEEHPNGNIIVDLAAQTASQVHQWINSCDLFEIMQELGYTVYWWHVMDDSADCANLLKGALETFAGKQVNLVVVQNYGRGTNFEPFESSTTFEHARAFGAQFIAIERLQESLAQKIDFSNFSFWAAANSREFMKVAERQRVKVWLKNAYSQLDCVLKSTINPTETA